MIEAALELLAQQEEAVHEAKVSKAKADKAVKDAAAKVEETRGDIFKMMKKVGLLGDKITTAKGEVSIAIVETPGSLVIENEAAIPEEFFESEPVLRTDKIKARIQSGMPVKGARIEKGETLRVSWSKE